MASAAFDLRAASFQMPTTTSTPGMIYGVLLNDPATLAEMGEALNTAPYKAPPKAPVLYIKTSNTRAGDGAAVAVPAKPGTVCVGATLGLVIGRAARRVPPARAMEHVRAYVIASDLFLPTDSVFRPAVRHRCRDGFCPMSEEFAVSLLPEPSQAQLTIHIDGAAVQRRTLSGLVRSAPQLLADVSDFMTLEAGDVLLLGAAHDAPRARAGQSVRIEVDGLGALRHHLVAEADLAGLAR